MTQCDQTALALALTEALHNPADRRQRGENGRLFAQVNYGWDAIAARMIDTYRQLLA